MGGDKGGAAAWCVPVVFTPVPLSITFRSAKIMAFVCPMMVLSARAKKKWRSFVRLSRGLICSLDSSFVQ